MLKMACLNCHAGFVIVVFSILNEFEYESCIFRVEVGSKTVRGVSMRNRVIQGRNLTSEQPPTFFVHCQEI